jgi:hypothetical protein
MENHVSLGKTLSRSEALILQHASFDSLHSYTEGPYTFHVLPRLIKPEFRAYITDIPHFQMR